MKLGYRRQGRTARRSVGSPKRKYVTQLVKWDEQVERNRECDSRAGPERNQ
jgi:hypothetical protein